MTLPVGSWAAARSGCGAAGLQEPQACRLVGHVAMGLLGRWGHGAALHPPRPLASQSAGSWPIGRLAKQLRDRSAAEGISQLASRMGSEVVEERGMGAPGGGRDHSHTLLNVVLKVKIKWQGHRVEAPGAQQSFTKV